MNLLQSLQFFKLDITAVVNKKESFMSSVDFIDAVKAIYNN